MARLVVRGGTLIDGTGADPLEDVTVVAEDGRFTAVEPGGEPPADAEVVETDGLTLLPGLIDLHSHLGIVDVEQIGELPLAVVAARLFDNARRCLMSGHTTAREVAGADGGLRQAIEAGLVEGPRLFPSGPMISQTGGHADHRSPFLPHAPNPFAGAPGLTTVGAVADGPDEVRRVARDAFRHGATQLKVAVSGGVVSLTDRLEDTQLTVPELEAAVAEARARDTYVTAHAHNVDGIHMGLEAGLECFEHGTMLDEETAALMAERGAALVPTLTVAHLLIENADEFGLSPEIVERGKGLEARMTEAVELAVAAGVTVGSGTDLIGAGQDDRGLELVLRSRIHTPMDAIVAATATNASILRRDDLGVVAPGRTADLIAVDFPPLDDPEPFADPDRVVLVVKDGAVVKDTRG